jgi:hypothetical protein
MSRNRLSEAELLFQLAAGARPGSRPHQSAIDFARRRAVRWPWLEATSLEVLQSQSAAIELGRRFTQLKPIKGERVLSFGPLLAGRFLAATASGRLFSCSTDGNNEPLLVAEFEPMSQFGFSDNGTTIMAAQPGRGCVLAQLGALPEVKCETVSSAPDTKWAISRNFFVLAREDGRVIVRSNDSSRVIFETDAGFKPSVLAVSESTAVIGGALEVLQIHVDETGATARRVDIPAGLRLEESLEPTSLTWIVAFADGLLVGQSDLLSAAIAHFDGMRWSKVSDCPRVATVVGASAPTAHGCTGLADVVIETRPQYPTSDFLAGYVAQQVSAAPPQFKVLGHLPIDLSIARARGSAIWWPSRVSCHPRVEVAVLDFPTPVVQHSCIDRAVVVASDELGNMRLLNCGRDQSPEAAAVLNHGWALAAEFEDQLWTVEDGCVSLHSSNPECKKAITSLPNGVKPYRISAIAPKCAVIHQLEGADILLRLQDRAVAQLELPTRTEPFFWDRPTALSDRQTLIQDRHAPIIFNHQTMAISIRHPTEFGMGLDGAVMPDANTCVTAESGIVKKWSLATGELLAERELDFEDHFEVVRMTKRGLVFLMSFMRRTEGREAWLVDPESLEPTFLGALSEVLHSEIFSTDTHVVNWSAGGALRLLNRDFSVARDVLDPLPAGQLGAKVLDRRWFIRAHESDSIELIDCTSPDLARRTLLGAKGLEQSLNLGIVLPPRYFALLLGHACPQAVAMGNGHAAILQHGAIARYALRNVSTCEIERV